MSAAPWRATGFLSGKRVVVVMRLIEQTRDTLSLRMPLFAPREAEPLRLEIEPPTLIEESHPQTPLRRSLSLVTTAWLFGSIYVTSTSGAPLALFANGLGASKFQFGLLSAMPFIASMPSLPASVLVDRT